MSCAAQVPCNRRCIDAAAVRILSISAQTAAARGERNGNARADASPAKQNVGLRRGIAARRGTALSSPVERHLLRGSSST